MGHELADLTGAVPGHDGEQFAAEVGDPQRGVAELDGDDAPGMWQADLDAMVGSDSPVVREHDGTHLL